MSLGGSRNIKTRRESKKNKKLEKETNKKNKKKKIKKDNAYKLVLYDSDTGEEKISDQIIRAKNEEKAAKKAWKSNKSLDRIILIDMITKEKICINSSSFRSMNGKGRKFSSRK
tara:strand:- start:44 stop:385 length:342 start_codon:yes stop_codon:yes gene_type:complete